MARLQAGSERGKADARITTVCSSSERATVPFADEVVTVATSVHCTPGRSSDKIAVAAGAKPRRVLAI